jgi:hypothetical protein
MSTIDRVLMPFLARYAKQLLAAGFRVYLFHNDVTRVANGGQERVGTSFQYSRVVDGRTCYGNVQRDYFDSVKHFMPITPSKEHGAAMFVGENDRADIASAERCASPENYNTLVGTQENYNDPQSDRLYVEVTE